MAISTNSQRDSVFNLNLLIRNFFSLMLGGFVTKFFLFLIVTLLARILGPEKWGEFFFCFTLLGFMQVVSDFGFQTITIREIATAPERGAWYFWNTSFLRLLIAIISFVVIILFLKLTHYSYMTILTVMLLSLSLVPRSFYVSWRALFNGREKMHLAAIGDVILFGLFFVTSTSIALIYKDIHLISIAWIISTFLATIFAFSVGKHIQRLTWQLDIEKWLYLLRSALPFISINIVVIMFQKIDVVILSVFKGNTEVGLYSAAYNILDGIAFLASAYVSSIFPLATRLGKKNFKKEFSKLYHFSLKWILIISVFIAFFISIYSQYIIHILYGPSYNASARALQILILSAIFMSLTNLNAHILFSKNKERYSLFSTSFSLILNVILNVIFIPKYGYMAAAATTFVTICINAIIHLMLVNAFVWDKKTKMLQNILSIAYRIGISGLITALILYWFYVSNILLGLVIAISIYFIFLLISRVFSIEY